MMTFIMTKHPQSRGRDAVTRDPSPPLALEAASEAGMAALIARARWLDELDQNLRRCLPAALAAQCRLANVDRDVLVFLANAPVWKAKLRLEADALLRAADAAGLSVRSLVVKVAAAPPVPPGTSAAPPLSNAVRESLRTTAQSVQDPGLRAQLLKLASLPDRSK
jgi:hypothetical protein